MTHEIVGRLVGESLRRVRCAVSLVLDVGPGWLVTVENEYTFTMREGVQLDTTDGQEPVIVAALEAGVATAVSRADVDDTGGLTLGVAGGLLRVEACHRFESWNVVGPRGQRVVSMPGGGLAVWS